MTRTESTNSRLIIVQINANATDNKPPSRSTIELTQIGDKISIFKLITGIDGYNIKVLNSKLIGKYNIKIHSYGFFMAEANVELDEQFSYTIKCELIQNPDQIINIDPCNTLPYDSEKFVYRN